MLHHTSTLHSILYSGKMLSCIAGSSNRVRGPLLYSKRCITSQHNTSYLDDDQKRKCLLAQKRNHLNHIIYSSCRKNMHLEYITLHHLFHACALSLCLCSSILHQSPSSVLTQSLWLGNAETERRWQSLLSYCVSHAAVTGQMFIDVFAHSCSDRGN